MVLGPAYMVTKNWTKAETEAKTEKGPVLKVVISFTPKPSSIRSKGKSEIWAVATWL